jgi:hypothetical protein
LRIEMPILTSNHKNTQATPRDAGTHTYNFGTEGSNRP